MNSRDVLSALATRLDPEGKIVDGEDGLELRSHLLGLPLKILVRDNLFASIHVMMENRQGVFLLSCDPGAKPINLDDSDPWDAEKRQQQSEQHFFSDSSVHLKQFVNLADEVDGFGKLPDSQQILQIFSTHDLALFLASFDLLQISYLRSLRDIEAPIHHLRNLAELACRTAAHLSSGESSALDRLTGQYQSTAAGLVPPTLLACDFCDAANPSYYLRCNNCGAARTLR